MQELLKSWTQATSELAWGVQRVFHDAFTLVSSGDVHLVYGADYRDDKPCLVNAVAQMSRAGGGNGIPSLHFGRVVSLFDRINSKLEKQGVNDGSGYVSPLAAEILLHNFAPLKDKPLASEVMDAMKNEAFAQDVYVEPSDEDMTRDWMETVKAPSPEELNEPPVSDEDEFNKAYLLAKQDSL